jgi:hypothetical protein
MNLDDTIVAVATPPGRTNDIIEISGHGSPVVLRHIVELALARPHAVRRSPIALC